MIPNARATRRRVDGVLLLDKPVGLSSNAALQKAKRLFNAEKAGHTGTLDPLASGVLPICFGTATRFAQFLLDAPKRYVATVHFGVTTSTQDAEGDVVETRSVTFDVTALDVALSRFVGRHLQTPPMHSALKRAGRPYYDYARRGVEIARSSREIIIYEMRRVEWRAPIAVVEVLCSKGTYVRTLAADLGEALGCGAHVAALRRTSSGGFHVANASSLDALETMDDDERDRSLLPPDALVAHLSRIDVDRAAADDLLHGRPVTVVNGETANASPVYAVFGPDGLVGVADIENGTVKPRRLMPTSFRAKPISGDET